MLYLAWLGVVFLALLTVSPPVLAQKRIALVVGNSAYQHTSKLDNPKNDAADLGAALKQLGFEVMEGTDLDKAAMDRTIRDFAAALDGAEVGLLFYAGHGLQVGGQNYLVPVDAKLTSASALDFEMVRLDLIQRTMERATRTNLIFLDACRDNPLARNLARAMGTRSTEIGRGLAAVESGVGTLISYSTQPGNVALDGAGRNSPFAGALAKQMGTRDEDLASILIGVRNEVMAATQGRQIPWEHSALTARFYFTPPKNPAREIELTFWVSVKDSKSPTVLNTYLERYPDGEFAPLARALIEHYERQLRVEQAAREEERRRQEEVRKASEAKRLEAVAAAEGERLAAIRAAEEAKGRTKTTDLVSPIPEHVARDPEGLTRALQRELARVGCFPGAVDGRWGAKAIEALREFSRQAKVSLSVDKPTEDALRAIAAIKHPVCILRCAAHQKVSGGRCVSAKSEQPAAKAGGSTKLCWPEGGRAGTTILECTGDPRERPSIRDLISPLRVPCRGRCCVAPQESLEGRLPPWQAPRNHVSYTLGFLSRSLRCRILLPCASTDRC